MTWTYFHHMTRNSGYQISDEDVEAVIRSLCAYEPFGNTDRFLVEKSPIEWAKLI